MNEINQEKGVSNWLLVLPVVENEFDLTRHQFYNQYNISCKKGGFINTLHNDVRGLTAKLLSEVCHDLRVKPTLLPLTGGRMEHRTAIETNEARLDIRAR